MDTPNKGRNLKAEIVRWACRALFRSAAVKRTARLMDVPTETAKVWINRNLSAVRCDELALKLLAEIDVERRRLDRIERVLQDVVDGDDKKIGGAIARPGNAADGAALLAAWRMGG